MGLRLTCKSLCLLGVMAACATAQSQSELVLRGDLTPPVGAVAGCAVEGVSVVSPVSGRVLVGWEHVREVRGEHADAATAFAGIADDAWRGLSRLGRGDIPAAEPLLERLFATYKDRTGPTAAAVSGGLLRCRLERGAHTLAVSAWLSWMHAGRDASAEWFEPASSASGPAGADPETGLLPELPPLWIDLPAVRVFGEGTVGSESFGERERALAELYRHAARAAAGESDPMPRLASTDEGVRLVWDIVAAQSTVAQERAAGRKALEFRLRREPTGWVDAWIRTAIGRSLLLEDEPEQHRRGVIELLAVRVLHDQDVPYLAGLALADAAVALRDLGDEPAAAMLRRELLDRFPGHPATGWDPILLWDSNTSAGAERTDTDAARHEAGAGSDLESRKPYG